MKARALVASFVLCGIVTGGALFATRSASAATNSSSVPVSVTCTSSGQECDGTYQQSVVTTSLLTFEFESAWNGCATFSVTFVVDGAPVFTSAPLAPFTTTGIVDAGPVSAGSHLVELRATGVTGGCDAGTLSSWAGRFTATTNDDPVAVTPTPTVPAPGDTTAPPPSGGSEGTKSNCKKPGRISSDEFAWKNQGRCVSDAAHRHGGEDENEKGGHDRDGKPNRDEAGPKGKGRR